MGRRSNPAGPRGRRANSAGPAGQTRRLGAFWWGRRARSSSLSGADAPTRRDLLGQLRRLGAFWWVRCAGSVGTAARSDAGQQGVWLCGLWVHRSGHLPAYELCRSADPWFVGPGGPLARCYYLPSQLAFAALVPSLPQYRGRPWWGGRSFRLCLHRSYQAMQPQATEMAPKEPGQDRYPMRSMAAAGSPQERQMAPMPGALVLDLPTRTEYWPRPRWNPGTPSSNRHADTEPDWGARGAIR